MHVHTDGSRDGGTTIGALRTALVVTGVLLVVQVAGGMLSGSLALLADAAHLMTDLAGLALAYTAARLAGRPATPQRSYGLYRVEILAAAGNAAALLLVSVFLLYEAWSRLARPEPIEPRLMLGFGAVSLVGNVVALLALRRPGPQGLNLRAAYLEVVADALGTSGVVVASLVILATGWTPIDPILSAVLCLAIAPRSLRILREAVHVLLEGTPPSMEQDRIQQELLAEEGVVAVHDLHVWSLTSGVPVLTAHIVVRGACSCDDVLLDRLAARLKSAFGVEHATLQIEHADRAAKESARF